MGYFLLAERDFQASRKISELAPHCPRVPLSSRRQTIALEIGRGKKLHTCTRLHTGGAF